MRIGLPKEIKDNENRVGMTPGADRARWQMKNISLPALKLFPTQKMHGRHKWWLK
jgi:hypothetical protein